MENNKDFSAYSCTALADNFSAVLRGRTARYFTLGCKLNFAETASLRLLLEQAGVRTLRQEDTAPADICILNTCSVTDVADQKGRQMIRRMRRGNPAALIVVTGCYAQLQPAGIVRATGADLVVGTEHKGQIPSLIASALRGREAETAQPMLFHTPMCDIHTFVPSCSRGDRTRYFLKVQDGCNHFCTYCTIPMARGRSRNGSIASLVDQAEDAARAGGREIVLTGVNIGDFGRTTGESFLDLLRALDAVRGVERFRISSIEPELLTDEIIAFCASSRAFMPHFHLPLQSGSDTVLRLMRRRYDTAQFRNRVEAVLAAMPDAFIGVDVIVGMRGETPDLFEESKSFIEQLPVSQLHVFPYSERPGTKALDIPYVVDAAHCHAIGQPGMAKWFEVQFKEEQDHAKILFNYVVSRSGKVTLKPIDAVPTKWDSILDVFESTLAHEQKVTAMINNLFALTTQENDYATQSMLKWFIDEQVEEEENAQTIIDNIKMIKDNGYGIYMLDKELGARTYTQATPLNGEI